MDQRRGIGAQSKAEGGGNGGGSRKWLRWAGWAALGVALAHCSSGSDVIVDGPDPSAGAAVGTAGFQLDVGGGVVVNTVTATLTLPDGSTETRNFDVSPDDASIAVYLGALPAGDGYQVVLSATATNGATCTGTGSFKIKTNQTVVVSVKMQCSGGVANPDVGTAKIQGELVPATGDCPAVVERIEAAPSRVSVGSSANVEVFPTDGTPALVSFSASGGTLAANGTRATFRCTAEGEFVVTADVTRAGCVQHASARVECIADANGGAGGGPATNPGGQGMTPAMGGMGQTPATGAGNGAGAGAVPGAGAGNGAGAGQGAGQGTTPGAGNGNQAAGG